MFKKPVNPLSEGMAEAISKSINRLQYVEEKASRPADRAEGDEKLQDITGSEPVKTDGSATKAPARKGDQSGAEPKQKVKEEVDLDEDMNALTTAAAIAPAAALAASGLLYKGYGKSKRSVMDRVADTKDAKRRHKDSIKQADKYLSKSTNSKTLEKYKKQKDDSQNKLKQSSYLKSLSRKEEVDLDEVSTEKLRDYASAALQDKNKAKADKRWKYASKAMNTVADREVKAAHARKHNKMESVGLDIAKGEHNIKEEIEITELHMSLLEAHGIEKKMAEKIKKVFDAMSTADKAAFMKAYLKNPKAANEYMADQIMKGIKAAGGMNLGEAMDAVDAKALKGKHSERKDKDIDNDGDVDSSDEYLHKRRQAIAKAMKKEEVDLEESITKMSHGRLKFHMNNKSVPHGSYSWDQMKAERDRRLKAGEGEAYKKAKMSMSEEVELDEASQKKLDKAMSIINARITKPGQSPKHPSYHSAPEDIKAAARNLAKNMKEEFELDEAAMKGNYARVTYDYREDYYHITVYKNGKEVASDDGYFGANETGNPLIKKFTDLVKKAGLKPEGLPIVDEDGKKGVFKGNTFKWNVKEEFELDEGYTINHKTFSSAVQHAKAQVEKQGYTIDDDEWDRKVAMGPKKPGTGKTNRYTIDLMKGGKETRRKLQMQVYYDEGRYELNMYIS